MPTETKHRYPVLAAGNGFLHSWFLELITPQEFCAFRECTSSTYSVWSSRFSSCASPLTDVCNISAALDEHQLQLKLPVDMLIPTEAIFLLPRVNIQKPIHHSTNSYEMQPRNKSPCYGVVSFSRISSAPPNFSVDPRKLSHYSLATLLLSIKPSDPHYQEEMYAITPGLQA